MDCEFLVIYTGFTSSYNLYFPEKKDYNTSTHRESRSGIPKKVLIAFLTKYFKNRILCTTGVSSKRLPPFVCHPIYWGDMYSRPTWRLSEVVLEQARPPCTKSKGHDKGALVGHISNYF